MVVNDTDDFDIVQPQGFLTHNMHVWEPNSVIKHQIAPIVFKVKILTLLNVLWTGPGSVAVQIVPTVLFWMKTIHRYMDVFFSYKNGSPARTRSVQR